jgi:hypothetical protein
MATGAARGKTRAEPAEPLNAAETRHSFGRRHIIIIKANRFRST